MRFALLGLAAALGVAAAPPKNIASYDIKARYDAQAKTIKGSETLTWLNDSPDTVPTLRFHLYMNAFKNQKSTFMRESGGQLRGDYTDGKDWGAIDIHRMRIGAADVTKSIRFIQPDDGNPDDQTVIEVPLPQPAKPGSTVQVDIDFTTQLPRVFARTGFHGTFVLAGQWFPKLGVWETAGFRYSTQGAWNCHQFHANSEFFANYGRYRVELTVPAEYVVGATGEMKSKNDSPADKTATYLFEQDYVTDFAWTAQPNYIRVERTFEADRMVSPEEIASVTKLHGIPAADAKLSDVKMILLVQPEHARQTERYLHALASGLKYFGLWYGRYPHKTITLVDPPHGAGGAGGMEYPTFITGGTSFENPAGSQSPEMVTVHEFGHQFWMQLVATNEFEESWLDEGFNTYSTTKIMDLVYGRMTMPVSVFGVNLAPLLGLPRLTNSAIDRAGYLSDPVSDNIVRNAWQYKTSNSYGINSYMKTGVALNMLERMVGAETMARLMRIYHQRYRFAHPNSKQFQQVAEEVSGRSLAPFFDQFVFGHRELDYAVESVRTRKLGFEAGLFDTAEGRKSTSVKDAEKLEEEKGKDKNFKPLRESTVTVVRNGDAVLPVEIEVKFDDGSVERRQWDGEYRWTKLVFRKAAEVETVVVDPQRKYTMDLDWSNNSWRRKPNNALTAGWTTRLLYYVQSVLFLLGGLV